MSLHRTLFLLLLASWVPVAACSDTAGPPPESAQPASDAGGDGLSSTPLDAGNTSAGNTDILGTLAGSCGDLRNELTSSSSTLKTDTLTFVAGESYGKPSLSSGGQTLFDTPNAGGSSTESEVMSFEVLHFCEGATLLKTETEISYGPAPDGGANAITDLLVEIAGKKVGVSVTRAYKPKSQGAQTDAELKSLLEKKLAGINASTARVLAADKWIKQILHVLAATQESTDAVARVLPSIDSTLRSNTVVLVTHTVGGGFLYCNPDPPLGDECP